MKVAVYQNIQLSTGPSVAEDYCFLDWETLELIITGM